MTFYFYITAGLYSNENRVSTCEPYDGNICISADDFNEAAENFAIKYNDMIERLRNDPKSLHKWIKLKPQVGFETKYGFDKYSFEELEYSYYFAVRMLEKMLVRQELDTDYCDAIRSLSNLIRKQNETI